LRHLLDKSSQRMLSLIELLVSQDNWITISHLAKAAGASGRTVSDDITKLKDRWDHLFDVEVSVKRGVKMHCRSISAVSSAFRDIFKESTALRWLRGLLFHPNKKIEFYEDMLFSSRSTLGRMIPKINYYLNPRGISILCKNGHCQIIAQDEQYLRQFYAAFLLEMNGMSMPELHADFSIERMWRIIIGILLKAVPPTVSALVANDDIIAAYHVALYVVSLIRESQGYNIECDYDIEDEITPEDISYIKSFFPGICASNLRPINAFIHKNFNGWSSPEEALVNEHSRAFITELFKPTQAALGDATMNQLVFITKSLYLTEKHRAFQTSVLFDRIKHFSGALKKNSRFMYKRAEDGLKLLSEKIGFDITPRLHDLLFWICLVYPGFPSFSCTKSALLISDFGAPHASFLVSYISGALNSLGCSLIDVDAVVYPDALSSCNYKGYDIILTTVPNLPLDHNNVLTIGCYPSHDNILEIYKRCMIESSV
jgi:hypothetical protein